MKSILIILSPAFGHYHATYKLAAQLKERGYEVIYSGENIHQASVVSQGFQFREFPFGNLVRDRYEKTRYFKWNIIPYIFFNLFRKNRSEAYRAYVKLSLEAREVIEEVNPKLILLDIHISTLYLFLAQTGVPCIQVCTTLSTSRVPQIPPINSGLIPQRNFIYRLLIEFLWVKQAIQITFDYVFQKMVYAGTDNNSFLRKYAKENGFRPGDFVNKKKLKTRSMQVLELVMAPKMLDYPWLSKSPHVFHIGPSVLLERKEFCDNDVSNFLKELKSIKVQEPSSKVIYCSLGTINYWQNKNCSQFFRKVIAAFKNRPGWNIIMVIGNDIPFEVLGSIPGNIKVFRMVPQLKVLSVCDAMITHGGLNTIKESILAGVPMVIYPLSNLWDQPGNAARVVYHKMGLRGNLVRDNAEKIYYKVNELLTKDEFIANVTAMSLKFKELNDSSTGVDLIDSLIKNGVQDLNS